LPSKWHRPLQSFRYAAGYVVAGLNGDSDMIIG
jgi:hypothetical protein